MISDEKKEEIRETADLVEVVGDYVRLKRSGNSYVGLCPFHDEKTPSFNVTPRLGIYKCFGCGASGDIFSFIMEMEGVGFNEALRSLADRYGVNLPEEHSPEEDQKHQEREGIYHALRFAGLYYFRLLKESDEADKARKYLEKRGYDGQVIKSFGLGYAPRHGEALLNEAKREGIREEYLQKADLIKPSKRGDGFYDTFRGRLIFPIFSPSGKVIAFAGRVLGDEKTAKYINSAQTSVYNKSEVVYGVNFAKNEIRKHEEVILVEGYTDVITMHQHEIKNVVASSGTALTSQQIRILKRYGKRLVMIYDSDSAGQAAMKRGINIALSEGMDVELLELPSDEDPDSFVKKFGQDSFRELKKKEASDFVTFRIRQAEEQGEMERPGDRTTLIASILESIAEMPDELARQVYVQHLHQKTQKYRNSSDKELFDQLRKILTEKKRKSRKSSGRQAPRNEPAPGKPPQPPPIPAREFGEPAGRRSGPDSGQPLRMKSSAKKRPHYEIELIRLMIQYGEKMIDYIGRLCNENLFEDDELRNFYCDIIQRHQEEEEVSVEHYAHREAPYPRLVGDVMLERYSASERHHEKTGARFKRDKDPYKTAKSTIKPLRLHFLKRLLQDLAEKTKTENMEEKRKYMKMQARTQREISHIERTPADELFPGPDDETDSGEKNTSSPSIFEYKMKEERE
ncbi:MAG: DNA primase [Balneolaceae bacterium]